MKKNAIAMVASLAFIACLPVHATDPNSAMFDLNKSMIPMLYAATTMASLCAIAPSGESDRMKKQRAANDKIIQGLTEPDKTAYLAEVRRVQAQIKAEFDALPPKQRESECAAMR